MKLLPLLLALVLMAACDQDSPGPRPPVESSKRLPQLAQFPPRLEAARGISNIGEKDDALAKLARDAAEAGDAKVARQAVENISNISMRDDAASGAALALAKRQQVKEATEVAQLISNIATRDKTLASIVKAQ